MIFDAIFFLVIPHWGLHRSWLSPIQLLTGILVGIWRVHWLSVFSNVPFTPTNVISSTHTLLLTFCKEESLLSPPPA
ncbi:hypothetical protein BDB00DRAFT_919619 [Zychaea mexicana]|uniref:uncharacterized protein n=1 Tax=Zychaea mexicana TaxID=64656 RepID=UPI0022FF1358|nr:uncharacterized protein BDB00DRAFT_919619 [Zychaea mexicana]KAI9489719.1 hypothetical protein BDB00DRAFT_919619 [Zychaea mexicana]